MLRSVLDPQSELQDSPSTPLRGNQPFPRIRLTDKHSKLAQIPIYAVSPSREMGTTIATLQDKIAAMRSENWSPRFLQQRRYCPADRFIPRKRYFNLDTAHYNLTRESSPPANSAITTELDIFGQISSLEATWRKKSMKNALERANVIPGLNDRRVLNFTERNTMEREKGRQLLVDNAIDQSDIDGSWRSKARNKPLIGSRDFAIEMPQTELRWVKGWIDWGAQEYIAAIVDSAVLIFDAANDKNSIVNRPVRQLPNINGSLLAIKWNHAGTRLAVGVPSSEIRVYSLEKLCWYRKCVCTRGKEDTYCHVQCLAWNHTDTAIIVVCTERVSAYTFSGDLIDTFFLISIYKSRLNLFLASAVLFSPNDRYLAISTLQALHIYTWPSLTPYLEIGPLCTPVATKPMAWHPWNPNILCVGGCPEKLVLSLWDIHHHKLLSCRKVSSDVTFLNEITWNKLSGELVAQWDYLTERRRNSVVAVLASLDRIVDLVSVKYRTSSLTWSPDHTQLALRTARQLVAWNFFGNEKNKWHNHENEEEFMRKRDALEHRRAMIADQTIHLQRYDIR